MAPTFAHFELSEPALGVGQSATVYRARNARTQTVSALKIFNEEYGDDANLQRRFAREAKVLRMLKHPAIVPIIDHGVHERRPWIEMRYCEAKSLKDHECGSSWTLGKQMRGLMRVAAALDHAHAAGVIHRDLKPSNILVDESGEMWLSDFGIAKVSDETSRLTSTGSVLGTAAYMSPEQAQDLPLTAASDTYSLGVIIYLAIFRQLPFQGASIPALMLKHISEPVPIPPGTNPLLAAVLRRALAKDPGDRWPTAIELVSSVNEVLIDALGANAGTDNIVRATSIKPCVPRLLIADESRDLLEKLDVSFRIKGVKAMLARSGPEALSKLGTVASFDAILVQLAMETVSGLELARTIRTQERRYGTRSLIVGMHASPDAKLRAEAIRSGLDQVIDRPPPGDFVREFLESYGTISAR